MTYLLDACALIAFLAEEIGKGCEEVGELLNRAETGEIEIKMSVVNLIEVYYGFIQKYGTVEAADVIMNMAANLPITAINTVSDTVYRVAARFKAAYSMSLADVFLCASAKSLSAVIVTKDDEIRAAEQAEGLLVFWIKK